MTKLIRFLCIGLLSSSSVIASAADENEEYMARGGVIITVGTFAAVSGIFGQGFNGLGRERAEARVTTLGTHTATDSALAQRVLNGTRPGDVLRFYFTAMTAPALQSATDDAVKIADLWADYVKNLTKQRSDLMTEISDLQRRTEFGEAAKVRRLDLLRNDASDVLKILAQAHLKAGESRALQKTLQAKVALAQSHRGLVRPIAMAFSLPVQYDMPIKVDALLTRILAYDSIAKLNGIVPNVRIIRHEARQTNLSQGFLKNGRRGMIGLALGGVIMLEEITVGAIGKQLTETANRKYHPAIRTEPAGSNSSP